MFGQDFVSALYQELLQTSKKTANQPVFKSNSCFVDPKGIKKAHLQVNKWPPLPIIWEIGKGRLKREDVTSYSLEQLSQERQL